jgi:hypothetical protein
MKNKITSKILIIVSLLCITFYASYLAFELRTNSIKDKEYKTDYFTVNQIKYGLLSGDNWSWQVYKIIELQVDSFRFTPENKEVLTKQLNELLVRVFDEADHVLHKKQKNTVDRIKFKVINTFVDLDKFKTEIPKFSSAIVDELEQSENKDQLKKILKEKVTGILNATNQDIAGEQHLIISKYRFLTIDGFNNYIAEKTLELREEQKKLGYTLIGLLIVTLLIWFIVVRLKLLYSFTFLISVIISCITLFIGISLPMIEIDARIATLDLKMLSSHILFKDQVIFFQTKSILDVVHILISNGKADTIFVGCLIFLFSVLFPVMKLISASIYLFIKERSNKFIKYMAFKSGKWSMADVMVVAIFMAYVGFQGILNNQLQDINMQNETLNLISTNRSNLQTGFLIFVSFVIFNLILAEFLKKVTQKDECSTDEELKK